MDIDYAQQEEQDAVYRPQVQDAWGRSPNDPDYGKPPPGQETDLSRLSQQIPGSSQPPAAPTAPTGSTSGAGAGASSVAQSWLAASPHWTAPPAPTVASSAPTRDPRADQFYQQLLGRSQQGLAVDRNNPIIRAQADAFAANQERARRNYLGDVAERQGPLANIQGERRLAAERAGQASGAFEAELVGKELTARRQEIHEALQLMGGVLSRDQQTGLQRELAQLDAAIAREGFGVTRRAQDVGLDQFLRELALREWESGQENDWRWAQL